jgi:uncharacterized protein (DUF885 family)
LLIVRQEYQKDILVRPFTELKLQELRQRATLALGARFDIRRFHAEVLQNGSLPLDVLETRIDRWIASQLE